MKASLAAVVLVLAPGPVFAQESTPPPPAAAAPGSPTPAPEPTSSIDLSTVPDEGPLITLPEMLRVTDAASYELAAARERIAQAQASLKRAWGVVEPNATTALTYTRNSTAVTVPFDTGGGHIETIVIQKFDQLAGLIDIKQVLFVMPAFLAISSARQSVEATRYDVQETRDQILLSVADTYYAALSAKRVIALSISLLDAAKEQERVAGARFEVGQTAKVDLLRAGVQRAQAEQNLVAARNAYAAAKASLEALSTMRVPFQVTPPPNVPVPQVSIQQAVDTALESRALLHAAELQTDIARRGVHSAWWEFAPTLSAEGLGRYSNAAGFTGQGTTALFQVTAAWTIYDGGRYADLDNARSVLRQAEAQEGSTRSSVVKEVRTSLYDLLTARASLVAAQEQERLARESARLVRDRYQAGVAGYLDVIDANNSVFSAGVNTVTSASSVETSALALRRAMGHLGLPPPESVK